MKEQLLALYELQTFDVRIAQINARIAGLDGARIAKAKLLAAQKELLAAQAALHEIESELKDNELKLKSLDEKRSSYEQRLYGGSSRNAKELTAMEKEIEIIKGRQGELDGRVLELYDQAESAKAKSETARRSAQALQKEMDESLAREAGEMKQLKHQLTEVQSERDEAAAKIADKALLSRYESLASKKQSSAIAKVKFEKCEGCRVSVTSFTLRKLYEDKEIQRCENCGRILLLDPQ